jgi:hypothetical protein
MEARVPESGLEPYPEGRVMGIIDESGDVHAAVASLVEAGYGSET